MRTYTYTARDYRDVFEGRVHGVAGVDPDGDLVWSRRADIVWAYETIVKTWLALGDYKDDEVVYAPSDFMRDEFNARQ